MFKAGFQRMVFTRCRAMGEAASLKLDLTVCWLAMPSLSMWKLTTTAPLLPWSRSLCG